MISRAWMTVALSVLTALLLVSPAHAQYMYLDSNGDGVRSTADVVNSAGPTTIDVWLDTAHNRDGTLAVCYPDTTQPNTIGSYVFSLRAANGTAIWSGFVNRQSTMTVAFGEHSSSTEYENGYGGPSLLSAGLYRLATIVLTIQSGTPSVDIVPSITGAVDVTSFGSACYGHDFDNTMKLGTDWYDVDGLPFGTGGSNQPPLLAQPDDMTVASGTLAFQTLTATDADHQTLTFSKTVGPTFLIVTTLDPGAGTATGQIALSPTTGDVGTSTGTVAVTDGFASAERSFQITVTEGANRAPSLSAPAIVTAVAGTTPRFPLSASDPDGQTLSFHKIAGPDYAHVATLASGMGGAVGSLDLDPTACDAGVTAATVEATDGIASDSKSIDILVKTRGGAPAQPPAVAAYGALVLAAGDLNGDQHVDLLAGGQDGELTTLIGHGDGSFTTSAQGVRGSELTSVTLGDWNSDGMLDAAITVLNPDHIVILSGDGAGGLSQTEFYPASSIPQAIRSGDLDRDGDLDLVVAQSAGVSVYLGNGDGTFATRTDYPMGGVSHGLVLEDFNLDGRLDVATANLASHDLGIRLGFGNGTLGDAAHIALSAAPFDLIARDWNRDGKLDLAIGMGSDNVRIYTGDGAGRFTAGATLSGFGDLIQLASADLDLDGNDDLIATSLAIVVNQPTIQLAQGHGDGTFGTNRVLTTQEAYGPASADLDEDGFPDLAVAAGNIFLWLNDAGGAGAPEARAFTDSNAPAGGKPTTCMRLEPVAGSYENADLDLTSITLSPVDGGGSIHAVATKSAIVMDTDGNGVAEVPV
ncbi:MAG TPA: FG-GAP-like repeat-containing protein, partial [Candidatus Eisenbacteria bacterium]|nr:FG-GAP-like repeat-containing protein [Candidatus Eisenbacteria bacterium]